MTALTLSFLGAPLIKIDGVSITLRRRRGIALLAYLAVMGEAQPRDTLATLFWPESDQQRAHKALRRDLSEINLALGQWLAIDRERVGLRPGIWSDVAHFRQLLAEAAGNPATARRALTTAVELYRADFLSGFTLVDSPQFDQWQFIQSEHLRQACASALAQVVEILSEQGEDEEAIEYARRWLNLDPLHEVAHRRLMHLYAHSDQQAAAMRQYEACRTLLQDELGVQPSPETDALYQQIHARQIIPIRSSGRSMARASLPRHNLPTQTTAFIGRQAEVAEIQRLLRDEVECRLINLVGPGGIGKTRLALAVATQIATSYRNGVCYVSLAPIGESVYTLATIAEALHFNFSGNSDPKEQLLAYLSQRELLLILDNFEHLIDASSLLPDILSHAPDVAILVTSRERLNLREEWCYEVQGLTFPPDRDQSADAVTVLVADSVAEYSALQLFIQRARQTEATFTPSSAEIHDIARICRLVEGMPLGLELAAPWIRSLRCGEIAVEIERNIDFLTTSLRNMPERHRSLRVVFEQTWQRLSPAERNVLSQMSLFRGGCTREAGEQVTHATLELISSLVDKALLRRMNTGRYELHELVRQFAEAKLQSNPDLSHQAQKRHSDYFVALLEAKTPGVKGRGQKETLLEIKADIDNVRLAWRRAVDEGDGSTLARCAECLFVYYLYGNGYDEGQNEFGRAVAALEGEAAMQAFNSEAHSALAQAQKENLICYLLAGQGYFLAHRFDLPAGQKLLEQALERLQQITPVDEHTEAFAQCWLGWAHYFQGRNTEGRAFVRQSLATFSKIGDKWGEGWSLLGFGNFIRDGRPAEAADIFRRGVILCQNSGDLSVLSYFALNLGSALRELGDFAQAQPFLDQSVQLSVELDNILGLGYSYYRRGQLEIDQGHYGQAIQSLQQSAAYFQEVGSVHANMGQIFLGKAFHLHGDHQQAERIYTQAKVEFQATGNRPWLARSLSALGTLAHDRQQLAEAEEYFVEALALWQSEANQEGATAATLSHFGQLLAESGKHRHAEAHHYLLQALSLAQKHQLAPLALEICLGMGNLLAHMGALQEAVELLALPAQHVSTTFDIRQKARRSLAELEEQMPIIASQEPAHAVDLWEILKRFTSFPILLDC